MFTVFTAFYTECSPLAHDVRSEEKPHLKVKAQTFVVDTVCSSLDEVLRGPTWDNIHTGAFATAGQASHQGRGGNRDHRKQTVQLISTLSE